MLQIITGKFFTTDDLYVTRQRGVLYTNYKPLPYDQIETCVGTLLPATTWDGISSVIYEVDERLEATTPDGEKEMIVSVGADSLIQDFAAVTSFALNITCAPDLDLVRRLTQSEHATTLGVSNVPRKYVGRVFEQEINITQGENSQLQDLLDNLVGLDRQTYKAAIRAIRRYVNGLHRIADDLDLAYALLVASIESLAQKFDDFESTWADYDQVKREAIDTALEGAPTETTKKVQNAILAHEHLSLARRYREFALAHLEPSFFREEAIEASHPARRSDLPMALERAYLFRSKYVHTLRELPRLLTMAPMLNDVLVVDGKPALTFHGLARVARHVIHQFIARAPKSEDEVFDYRQDLPNIVQAPVAPRYWIWQHEGYDHRSARRYLSGFLDEFCSVLANESATILPDINSVLEKIENTVSGLAKVEQRLPMLTLYLLFHSYLSSEWHRPDWKEFFDKYSGDFDPPSVESLIAQVLTGNEPEWELKEIEQVRENYFKQRYNKYGLLLRPLFEAAITLSLAELYRKVGNEQRGHELIGEAVEDLPGHRCLLELEHSISGRSLPNINWRELLLPSNTENSSA